MKSASMKGLSFGLTSGVITTLGLMVGLNASTHSTLAVLGGILTIAIADALSDSLGIHISQESNKERNGKEVWEATGATFVSKLVFALTFAVPVLLLPLSSAIIVSVVWGLLSLALLSYFIAKSNKENPLHVIGEHIGIALLVIVGTYLAGSFVATLI